MARPRLKPEIPVAGTYGIPMRYEIELEKTAVNAAEFALRGNVPGTVLAYLRLRGWGTASTGVWAAGT